MMKTAKDMKSTRIIKKTATIRRLPQTGAVPSANIRVVVRVRPPNQRENVDNNKIVVNIVDQEMLVFDPKHSSEGFFYHGVEQKGRDLLKKPNKNLQFVFDNIFNYESTNKQVFENTTQTLIKTILDGYNCSVFAYGATGAGKTHTMLGNCENPGITYLTMTELFRKKQELIDERNFEIGITYLEIYNELVQNLLSPGRPLQLMEDEKYGVVVSGLKINKIEDAEDLFRLLEKGNSNRTQHPTDANAESSRSHAVFQVYIQMENKMTKEIRRAKLSMIDLAGSERGAATGFVGARFTEGANINKSLLALGNCINSLADGHRHVPYRDSKLTRLLKDSLGGNCHTIMIANISPSSMSYEDTYNTLKYATRAKKIKSNMKCNIINKELHANQYVKIVEELNKKIESLNNQIKENNTNSQVVNPLLENELMRLFVERQKLLERMFTIEQSVQTTVLRRQLKEEADARLSGLCTDTPEKEEGHRRFGNTVNRLQSQENAYNNELADMNKLKLSLEEQTKKLVNKNPMLKQLAEYKNLNLLQLEFKYKAEMEKKKNVILEEELKSQRVLLGNVSDMLQRFYLQLKGFGLLTDKMQESYQALGRYLQNSKTISWSDNVNDIPTPTSDQINEEVVQSQDLNEMNEDKSQAQCLNNTFVLPQSPKKETSNPPINAKISAKHLIPKVYKDSIIKKAKFNVNLVHSKENKSPRSPLQPNPLKVQARIAPIRKPAASKRPFRH